MHGSVYCLHMGSFLGVSGFDFPMCATFGPFFSPEAAFFGAGDRITSGTSAVHTLRGSARLTTPPARARSAGVGSSGELVSFPARASAKDAAGKAAGKGRGAGVRKWGGSLRDRWASAASEGVAAVR